ncbi:phospholipase A [Photobacterium leiognathi]|uniref:phospholipase A n=1 Tax=Photobacterium leiognathi TaxID=553611 RepID=UPI002981B199|nr:phospholipase A [Photobacterium leiognathi]
MTQCKWRPIRHPLFLSSLLIGFNFIPATATAGEIVNNPLDYSSSNTLLLQQYKDNYVLPFYYTHKPNYAEYQSVIPEDGKLSKYNVNFQISLKYRLASGVFNHKDKVYVTYTQRSNWQAYASSAFFRDTEYEPSIFWTLAEDANTNAWGYAGTTLGLVHESNGRGGEQERSWNRAFADFTFQHDNYTLSIKPWVRLDFGAKDYNKDITNYMGYGRISMNWAVNDKNLVSFTARNVVESGFSRGYERITWSFPIYKRLRGYMMLESGYGISISDYNHYDNAGGIGFSF